MSALLKNDPAHQCFPYGETKLINQLGPPSVHLGCGILGWLFVGQLLYLSSHHHFHPPTCSPPGLLFPSITTTTTTTTTPPPWGLHHPITSTTSTTSTTTERTPSPPIFSSNPSIGFLATPHLLPITTKTVPL